MSLTARLRPMPVAGPTPSGLPAPDPLVLLLGRTSYGIAGPDLDRTRRIGAQAWIEEQLHPDRIDDHGLDARIGQLLPTIAMGSAQIIADYARNPDKMVKRRPMVELQAATLARRIFSRRQLYEVMVEFWSDHFNITQSDGPVRFLKNVDDREVIRAHALGKFPELLRASAQSPAMLHYLNNDRNVAGVPNENYAREVMELHTLGVNGGYTERDVKEVARAFTGWGIERRTGEFRFFPQRHDFGTKTVLGHELSAGRGVEDGLAVLDILARHPSSAHFVATKLCRRFVADTPAPGLVSAVARSYRETGGDVVAMLHTLLFSADFAASADAKLKRPDEFAVSALRTLGATLDGSAWLRAVEKELRDLGNVPFLWPAPNGYPDVASWWSGASALLDRFNMAFALVENRFSEAVRVDTAAFAGDVRQSATVVDRLADRILRRPLARADRAALIAFLGEDRDDADEPERLNALAGLMLASPYFQYR